MQVGFFGCVAIVRLRVQSRMSSHAFMHAPPFPGGSHVVVLNVAVRNLKICEIFEHIEGEPVSLWYSSCYPVNTGTLVVAWTTSR